MWSRRFASLCVAAALSVSMPAMAADNPFLGTWTVVAAKTAPWYDGDGADPKVDPALAHATVTFGKTSVDGPQPLACKMAVYSIMTIGPDFLFEGSLKDPAKDAAALGFKGDQILSLNEGCDSPDGDLEADFPMIDNDTILLGLNNVIYTLKRGPKAQTKP